jgi:hypothetical protein
VRLPTQGALCIVGRDLSDVDVLRASVSGDKGSVGQSVARHVRGWCSGKQAPPAGLDTEGPRP